jgi:hypothetical protein
MANSTVTALLCACWWLSFWHNQLWEAFWNIYPNWFSGIFVDLKNITRSMEHLFCWIRESLYKNNNPSTIEFTTGLEKIVLGASQHSHYQYPMGQRGELLGVRRVGGGGGCTVYRTAQSTVHLYLEYYSVCTLVRIGTPSPSPPSECVPKEGDSLACVWVVGDPNSDDWRRSLAFCLLCAVHGHMYEGGGSERGVEFDLWNPLIVHQVPVIGC